MGVFDAIDAPTAYATLVGGQPAAVWHDSHAGTIRYSFSSDNGASFEAFFVCRNSGEMYPAGPALFDVSGRPAITFWSREAGELRYIRDTNPNVDTYINWIAVLP